MAKTIGNNPNKPYIFGKVIIPRHEYANEE
jgi:hypothetical protein